MIAGVSTVAIRMMTLEDIPQVLEIDRLSFPIPWTERSYRYELEDNSAAELLVAEFTQVERLEISGYIGFWFIIDELHISTLAVHPQYRCQGIGSILLAAALGLAADSGGVMATLEVRTSNQAAVSMYQKFGFKIVGRRKKYYQDNREDAWLMKLECLDSIEAFAGGSTR